MRKVKRLVAIAIATATVGACVTLIEERAVLGVAGAQPRHASLTCSEGKPAALPAAPPGVLDPRRIRLITWNIHKNGDNGWDRDLARFAAEHSIVLLQEARLSPALRTILERAGQGWVLASAFLMNERDTGVLSAASVAPVAACMLREIEPVIGLPKTALMTRYALAGTEHTLMVANIHSINVSLPIGAYSAQLEAVARVLQSHQGPLILAGDLNTWTAGRREVLDAIAARLDLREVRLDADRRSRFWGRQVDHILVRGIDVIDAEAIEVDSSDHNPVRATLRIRIEAQ